MNLDIILRAVVQGRDAILQMEGALGAVDAEAHATGASMDDLQTHQQAAADASKVLRDANIDVAGRMAEARVRAENLTQSLRDNGASVDVTEQATRRLVEQFARQAIISDFAKVVRDSGESMRVLGPAVRSITNDLVTANMAAQDAEGGFKILEQEAGSGTNIFETFSSVTSSIGPILMGVGVALLALSSPFLLVTAGAAGATAAFLGLAGAAGILGVAGLALESHYGLLSPQMQQLQKDANALGKALAETIQPGMLTFLGTLDSILKDVGPEVRDLGLLFNVLMSAVAPFAKVLSEQLVTALVNIASYFAQWALAMQPLEPSFERFFGMLLQVGASSINGLLTKLLQLSQWFTDHQGPILSIVGSLMNALGTFGAVAMAGIGAFVNWFIAHWPEIEKDWRTFTTDVQQLWPVVELAALALQKVWQQIQPLLKDQKTLNELLQLAALAFVAAVGAIILIVGAIGILVSEGLQMVKMWQTVYDWLRNQIPAAVKAVGAAFSGLGSDVQKAIGFLGGLLGAIEAFFNSILTAAEAAWSQFAQKPVYWVSYVVAYIPVKLAELLGQFSVWVGQMIEAAVGWANQMQHQGEDAAGRFVNAVTQFLSQLPGRVAGWLGSVLGQLPGFSGQMGGWGWNAASQFFWNIVNGLAGLPGALYGIGQSIIQGLINGVRSMVGAATSAITQTIQGMIAGAKAAAGIASPSKVFAEQVGLPIAQGIAVGVQSGASVAHAAVTGMLGTMAGTVAGMPGAGVGVGGRPLTLDETNDILLEMAQYLSDIRQAVQPQGPQPFRRHSLASS